MSPAPQIVTDEDEGEASAPDDADVQADDADDDAFGTPAEAPTPEVDEALASPVPAGDDSFFSGTETVEDEVGPRSETEGETGEVEEPPGMAGMEDVDERHSFEEAINEGCARLGVVGIEEKSEKDRLQGEFEDVFEAFQLGHYGDRVMHEYLLSGSDDVHPVWGLAGSAMFCSAMVVYMRPDGDELVTTAKERLADLGGE